jgi:hypothetical protein
LEEIVNKKLPLSLVLVLLSLACSIGGVIPQVLGNSSNGWMCFESGNDIWVTRTDGSQLQNITNTDSMWETGCKLSWDANQILYTDLDDNLYLINRNGTGKRMLLENEGVKSPSWTPDGTKVIYVQMNVQDGNPIMSVYILDIASNEKAKIRESSPGVILSPVISPDGTKIAYSSGGVYTMDLDGSNVEQILQPLSDESAFFLSWSKDGKKIAFSTTNGVPYGADTWVEYGNIYVMNSDGSDLINITNSAPDPSVPLNPGKNIFKLGFLPCWTNGDQIVFLSNMDSHSYTEKPYIMNHDGTSTKLLIDQEMSGMDYQPDTRENSTAVATVDISTAINRTRLDATATAQAISLMPGASNFYMATDVDGTDRTITFSPRDDFYVFFDVSDVEAGTNFQSRWYALDNDSIDPNAPIQTIDYALKEGVTSIYFQLETDSNWPTGNYKVEIYMNDTKVGEQTFSVQ